ncbi:MAG: ADP-ribosylglycohydrolase family protein [Eubacteriales bacterium]
MELKLQIAKLRSGAGMSQEELAALLGVSRQAVQKWESGGAVPRLDHLIKMAKLFRVTLDSLVLEGNNRITEEMMHGSNIAPDYEHMCYWESYPQNLLNEYRQSIEEGKNISIYEKLFKAVYEMPAGEHKEKMADQLFDIVCSAGTVENYQYTEPSGYDEIRKLSSGTTAEMKMPSDHELKKKIKGAWLGRICGCLLGKPIEGIHTPELKKLLKSSDNYPLHRYITTDDVTPELQNEISYRVRRDSLVGAISCAPVDDDTNYTVLASVIVDRFGRDFKSSDVANSWVWYQGKDAYCTAERVAFKNFVMGYRPPMSAVYKNVYREWIGAQIRGDYFGYINPCDPASAAEMAWRDASISHVKNGIYGEMFASAMIAAAAGCNDMVSVVNEGLAQIPVSSRLYESVGSILSGYQNRVSKSEAFAKIHAEYDEFTDHGWCHTIPNAMIVAASLLYGGGDYTKSICMAVETGFDTDCNGATVGSVLGMMNGADSIGAQWTAPINGTLDTSIFGVGKVKVDDMVERTVKHIKAK